MLDINTNKACGRKRKQQRIKAYSFVKRVTADIVNYLGDLSRLYLITDRLKIDP